MLVPDKFEQIMRRAGRPLRVAPVPASQTERSGVLVAGLWFRVNAMGDSCAGVRGEDLTDLIEIVHAIGEEMGWSRAALETLRRNRHELRGGYDRVLTWEPDEEADAA